MKQSLATLSALGFAVSAGMFGAVLPWPLAALAVGGCLGLALVVLSSRDRCVRLDAEERVLRSLMVEPAAYACGGVKERA